MATSKIYLDLQQLLIKPNSRLEFIAKFIFTASFFNLAIIYCCLHLMELIYGENNFISSAVGGLIFAVIIGLFLGVCNGIIQRLIFRQYFSQEWIIAMAINGIFYGVRTVGGFFNSFINSNYLLQNNIPILTFALIGFLITILIVILLIAQGKIQLVSFKTQINKINWWLYLPLISSSISGFEYLPIAIVLWFFFEKYSQNKKILLYYLLTVKLVAIVLYFLVAARIFPVANNLLLRIVEPINILHQLLAYGNFKLGSIDAMLFNTTSYVLMFSAIQAILICTLCRKYPNQNIDLGEASLFATTPDINNYFQVNSIIQKVYRQINRIWEGNYDCNFNLAYWLTVNSDGEIVAYDPINQISKDNFSNTPFSLIRDDLSQQLDLNSNQTAKLQITFTPPGIMEIVSLSGIPFYWLVIVTFASLIIISFALTWIISGIL